MLLCPGSGKTFHPNKNVFYSTLHGRFENGDFESWLREFDACCAGNGWKTSEDVDDKIHRLPAFLRGQAASRFFAIPMEQCATYATAVAELKRYTCNRGPAANRENFYAEFECLKPRSGEDPAVFKWELENLLAKADPSLAADTERRL